MTTEDIKRAVITAAEDYPIKKACLFGSRARGDFREDSDVDLIIEFSGPVTLIILSMLKYRLEDMLNAEVDIIHGPLRDTDMIDIDAEVELYAA